MVRPTIWCRVLISGSFLFPAAHGTNFFYGSTSRMEIDGLSQDSILSVACAKDEYDTSADHISVQVVPPFKTIEVESAQTRQLKATGQNEKVGRQKKSRSNADSTKKEHRWQLEDKFDSGQGNTRRSLRNRAITSQRMALPDSDVKAIVRSMEVRVAEKCVEDVTVESNQ